jgi:hypothetical protein
MVMRIHLRLIHGIEETLHCPHCDCSMVKSMELAKHLLKDHRDLTSSPLRPQYTNPYTGQSFKSIAFLGYSIAHDDRYKRQPRQEESIEEQELKRAFKHLKLND